MASTTPILVSREEYLNTTYRPDRDWIDGETRERNLGEQLHARIQAYFTFLFRLHAAEWGLRGLPEQRVQVSAERFRVPDVCLIPVADPLVETLQTAPLLCIEILSRDDSMSDMQERVEDYLTMGVRTVWVIDPRRRRVYCTDMAGSLGPAPEVLSVDGTGIRIAATDIFAELDDVISA